MQDGNRWSMRRREFLYTTGLTAGALLSSASGRSAPAERPNILWLIGEDMGPDLGCYGTPLMRTPNLDRLAAEGARFDLCFTTAPVCSPSRSALITGMYQTSIGAHQHRSHRDDGYTLPEPVQLITDLFRGAGYFTANVRTAAPDVRGTGKTDFNFQVQKPFDGNDWNQRAEGQPFYAQVNFSEAHRGGAWPAARKQDYLVDPDKIEIPPYYPDHPVVRDDYANYLDSINLLDTKVGAVLQRLEDEGLAENTVVFFFGDNGRCHVWEKQWLYEGGIHVPLIVRWPGHIKPGTVRDDLISAIDISATSLRLAGIQPPAYMEGRAFLGGGVRKRNFVVAARDRCDETVDRIRCVRTKRHKYIRNFHPELPYTQPNAYKERSYPALTVMKQLHAEGKLTPAQDRFMAPEKPVEELYDLRSDPHEVHNLADSPRHQAVLQRLRETLDRWIRQTGDMGEVPEE